MKQALHIFRKDARHLWPQIVVALILVAAHAVLDVRQSPLWVPGREDINTLAGPSSFLLTLAWWSLIAAAIYEEMLPGDRQFWVTRPYSWKSLLGAKVLFVVAFVNVPLLISDCCILAVQGFPVLKNLPDLLFRQIPVSCWLILPSFALATISSGMGQFVLAWLAVVTGIILETMVAVSAAGSSSVGVDVASTWAVAAVMLAIVGAILWQYAKRRTLAVRLLLASFVFVIVPGLSAIPGLDRSRTHTGNQQRDLSPVRVEYDLTHAPYPMDLNRFGLNTGQRLMLPLRVSDLPAGTALVGYGEVAFGAQNNRYSRGCEVRRRGADYFQVVYLDPTGLQTDRSHRVNLRTTLHLTLVTDRLTTKAPLWQKPIVVPGVGVCEAYTEFRGAPQVLCRTGVRSAESVRVWMEYPGSHAEPVQPGGVTSEHRIFWGLSPVEKWVIALGDPGNPSSEMLTAKSHPEAELRFVVQRPLAEITRELAIADVDLIPYLGSQ